MPQLSPCSFEQLGHAVSNQVKLLILCRDRLWCGDLKSFHGHSLAELSEASDRRASTARHPPCRFNYCYGRLIVSRHTNPTCVLIFQFYIFKERRFEQFKTPDLP